MPRRIHLSLRREAQVDRSSAAIAPVASAAAEVVADRLGRIEGRETAVKVPGVRRDDPMAVVAGPVDKASEVAAVHAT